MKKLILTGIIAVTMLLGTNTAFSGSLKGDPPSKKASVVYLNEETFKKMVFDYDRSKEWKYEGSMPAIIDFYADWCGPCRQLSPVVEELAGEYSGKIIVYKVDTEKESRLAQKIGITALPTLLFIPAKGKPQVSMGVLPKSSLIKAINDVLLVK